MGKLRALLLTEGMHGMISQSEGMAKALKAEFFHKTVNIRFPWKLIPPKLTPISPIIFKDKIYFSENQIPDIIISCGRKSVIPSIFFKKHNKKIFTIHIQDPKINLENFDLVVAPEHDGLKGENVISTKGAIHYITKSEIEKARPYLLNKLGDSKIISLILGGPNKYYDFSEKQLSKIFSDIKDIFISNGFKVIVIPSIRTPEKIINLATKEFDSNSHVIQTVDKQAYLSSFALSEKIIVTCDSTSMISEAATSGKPIFVAHMKAKKNNYRFKRFFKLFKEMRIIKDLGDDIKNWTYDNLNEAERIAKLINIKIESK